jgi:hypothetical protein
MYSLTGSIEHRDASLVTWNKTPEINQGRSQSNPNILITFRSCVNNIKALSSYKVFTLVEDIPLCLKLNINIKLNMYAVWHNYFLFWYFFYWLLISVSKSHNQANIYKNLQMLLHIV